MIWNRDEDPGLGPGRPGTETGEELDVDSPGGEKGQPGGQRTAQGDASQSRGKSAFPRGESGRLCRSPRPVKRDVA